MRRLEEIVERSPPVVFPHRAERLPAAPAIRFERVSFRYSDAAAKVLNHFDLTIPYGQRLAVLGETGAGKSTLFDLLVRFRDPSAGGIFIGERDIRRLAEGDLRRLMTVVSQRAHIFTATVRDNLLMARPDAAEADLRAALAGARMLDFIDGLPDGIDTWVGEAGKLLSGGQARRLAVARAILKDAPIWLLDEPTEGLDRETAQSLLEAVMDQTAGRTLVLITHRPEMLEAMDRIVVLEGGRVAHSGSHGELLAAYSRYGELNLMK
jgi:ATP-binding cassette subfamily C protein CydC